MYLSIDSFIPAEEAGIGRNHIEFVDNSGQCCCCNNLISSNLFSFSNTLYFSLYKPLPNLFLNTYTFDAIINEITFQFPFFGLFLASLWTYK
jgi:hypothetical protein